jgi:hypothetical protein
MMSDEQLVCLKSPANDGGQFSQDCLCLLFAIKLQQQQQQQQHQGQQASTACLTGAGCCSDP